MTDQKTESIESLVHSAQAALQCPRVLVTILVNGRQIILATGATTPLDDHLLVLPADYSVCQYASKLQRTLVINDAKSDPLLAENRSVRELGVSAYLGVPIYVGSDVTAVICAMDYQPRIWRKDEIAAMEDAARRAADALLHESDTAENDLPLVTVH